MVSPIVNRRLLGAAAAGALLAALDLDFVNATIASDGAPSANATTARYQPTLTYTGATHKRQWDSDGVLGWAPHNELTHSEDFSQGIWTKTAATMTSGTTTPPAGIDSAWTFADSNIGGSGNVQLLHSFTASHAMTVKVSAYAQQKQLSFMRIFQTGFTGASGGDAYFDLANGTVGTQAASTNASIEAVGGGWYLCTIDLIIAAGDLAGSVGIRVADGDGDDTVDRDGTSDIYLTAVQVRRHPSPSAYVKTAGSAVYGARAGASNRKPVTNLCSYPQNIGVSPWGGTNLSFSASQSDPLGGTNAVKLVEGSGGAAERYASINAADLAFATGKTKTHSVYAKAGERTAIQLRVGNVGSNVAWATFDLSAGTVGNSGGTALLDKQIAAVDGAPGWYRCWFTHNHSANVGVRINLSNSGTAAESPSYAGDGSSGAFIFHAQLNEGGIEDAVGGFNLILSTDADGDKVFSGWNTSNATITSDSTTAPDGTTTADTFGDNGATGTGFVFVRQTPFVLPSAGTYHFSVFAKQKQLSWIAMQMLSYDEQGTTYFDLANGVVGATDQINGVITYWGNGWYRCSVSISSTSDLSGEIKILLADANNDASVDLDGTSDVYLWGAEVTKTSLYPFSGMPSTGFPKAGYTSEAAATNLITDSEDLTAAAWSITNTDSLTRTANQSIGPDGTTTLDKLAITDTTSEDHIVSDNLTFSASTNYVMSAFLRADAQRYVALRAYASSNNWAVVVADLYAGTITQTSVGSGATSNGSGIIPVGNGLYRVWMSMSFATVNAGDNFGFMTVNTGTPTLNTGNGVQIYAGTAGDAFHAGFAQFETGTYPSSYIRTSGGTAARNADVLKETGLAWYNATQGSLVAEGNVAGTGRFASIATGTSDEMEIYRNGTPTDATQIKVGGSAVLQQAASTNTNRLQRARIVLAYKENDSNSAFNGTAATTDTSVSIPSVTTLHVGANATGSNQANGNIRSFKYYNTRRSNATIATDSKITDDGTAYLDELAA